MKTTEKELRFKTNINCAGCIASVKPHLDPAVGTGQWQVDTTDQNKVLSVPATADQDHVIRTVQKAGFKIEPLGDNA